MEPGARTDGEAENEGELFPFSVCTIHTLFRLLLLLRPPIRLNAAVVVDLVVARWWVGKLVSILYQIFSSTSTNTSISSLVQVVMMVV